MIQIGIASAVVLSLVNLTLLILVLKRFGSISKEDEKGSDPEELPPFVRKSLGQSKRFVLKSEQVKKPSPICL